jgi:oxygen-independent coproporphyrinogen-3 oxidase
MDRVGLYIHIPFCRKKCDYCSFYSIEVSAQDPLIEGYLDKLNLEFEVQSKKIADLEVDTLYLGGGTPSLLSEQQVKSIFDSLYKNFQITSDAEITIECNPADYADSKIAAYIASGVNRISLGVQTFDQAVYNTLGRNTLICDLNILESIINRSDLSLSVDIIIGVPGQSEKSILKSLDEVIKYNIQHVSVYLLSIEKNTPLFKRLVFNESLEKQQKKQFSLVIKHLQDAGYEHYEVSNFALPGYAAKHNLKYWTFQPYLGFGVGAHSFYAGQRFSNISDVDKYINSDQISHIDERSFDSELVEFFMTGLRLRKGVSEEQFFNLFKQQMPAEIISRLEEQIDKKSIVKYDSNGQTYYQISESAFFLTDEIIYQLVESFL